MKTTNPTQPRPFVGVINTAFAVALAAFVLINYWPEVTVFELAPEHEVGEGGSGTFVRGGGWPRPLRVARCATTPRHRGLTVFEDGGVVQAVGHRE